MKGEDYSLEIERMVLRNLAMNRYNGWESSYSLWVEKLTRTIGKTERINITTTREEGSSVFFPWLNSKSIVCQIPWV